MTRPGRPRKGPGEPRRATNTPWPGEDTRAPRNSPQTGPYPFCRVHRNLCAYTGREDGLCEWCHAPFSKITAVAYTVVGTYTTTRRNGVTSTEEDRLYTGGYGETPLGHIWRHAEQERIQAARVRRAPTDPDQPELGGAA